MEKLNLDLIHPTAIVHPNAKLGRGTRIGPFSIIGEDVVLGENCDIQEHVVLRGCTTLGTECRVFPFAVIGGEPQYLGYKNEPTKVVIGDRVVLREGVTVHRGIPSGRGLTTIGDDSYIMAYAHVAHDCSVGKRAIIVNSVQLAGHVTLEDYVTIGGQSEVAQYCRVGSYCYIAGGSTLRKDVPPFMTGKGNEFQVQGINLVGLQRLGFTNERIRKIKDMYKAFYMQKNTVSAAIEKLMAELPDNEDAQAFIAFLKNSKMGFER